MMVVGKKVFSNLCYLYPKTTESLKETSIKKHDIIVSYLTKAEFLAQQRIKGYIREKD
jgi:hypothetical protein